MNGGGNGGCYWGLGGAGDPHIWGGQPPLLGFDWGSWGGGSHRYWGVRGGRPPDMGGGAATTIGVIDGGLGGGGAFSGGEGALGWGVVLGGVS